MLVERLPLVTYTLRSEPSFPPLYVSPQLEALFGFPAAAILADDEFWFSRMAQEDVGGYRAALEHIRATHEPMSVEYRVTAGDGREVWVRDVAVVARERRRRALHPRVSQRRHAREDARARARCGARAGGGVLPRLAGRPRHHRRGRALHPRQRRTGAHERDNRCRLRRPHARRGLARRRGDGRPDPRRGSAHGRCRSATSSSRRCATASAS